MARLSLLDSLYFEKSVPAVAVSRNTGSAMRDRNRYRLSHVLALVLSRRASNFLPRDVFGVRPAAADPARDAVFNDEFVLLTLRVGDPGHTRAMTIKYKILKQFSLIVGSRSGRADADEAPVAMKRIIGDPDFDWTMDRIFLVDEKADLSQINLSGLRKIRDEVFRMRFGDREPDPSELPVYRVAVVCPNPGNAAIIKLYGTAWETAGEPIIGLKVFDTVADALAWLGQDTVSEEEIRQALAGP
jgi:hypothetical protein